MDYIFENQNQVEQYKKWQSGKETVEEARAFHEKRPMPAYCYSCHVRQSRPRAISYRDEYIMSISDTHRENRQREEEERAKERERRQKKEKEAKRSSDSGEVVWNVLAERDDRSDTISSELSSLTETGSNLYFYDGSKDKKTVETLRRFLKDEPDREVVHSAEDVAGTLEDFIGTIEDMPEMHSADCYDQYLAMKAATTGDNDGTPSEWNSEDCSSESFAID